MSPDSASAPTAPVHPAPPDEVSLVEHETREAVPLSLAQARQLQRLSPTLEIRPSFADGFDLTATSWIGNVRVGDLTVTIEPKLSIARVLFLVSYSLHPDAWRDTDFDYAVEDRLLEAMAPGFVALTREALARGLRRGYRQRDEALQTVRGQVRFDDQLRSRFGRFPPAEVTYDEFTEDVAENRVLLAAIERLGRLRPRSRTVRRDLRRLRTRFQGVTLVDYSAQPLPEITFDRLNRHYRPAIRLARLILRDSSIARRRGETRSTSFLVNMNRVFEDFAVVALREALGLSERSFPQQTHGRRLWLDERGRVRLEPDLSWWRGGRQPVFVGDVKYKDLDDGGVRNEDLYQVLAYLEATGLREGFLVYPVRAAGREPVVVRRSGRRVRVHGWSLDELPEEILGQVRITAEEIRTLSERRTRCQL